jgi:hypothetical protein
MAGDAFLCIACHSFNPRVSDFYDFNMAGCMIGPVAAILIWRFVIMTAHI